ncbi:MAG: aminotransferase class III-fold pyridoxal phosphate-dependent enzyme [Clostridioides sp.]|nr:aminotransferase class III-fold pyridoxal phosphate-dependent enzyme [Clostridioides sp.]
MQAGIGRTGKLFGFEHLNVKGDIITLAKGLAGGVPIGAVLANEKCNNVFKPGDQGSTFGGNLLAMTAGLVVLDEIEKEGFYEDVLEKGEYIKDFIEKLQSPLVKSTKGKGLIIGIDVDCDADKIQQKAQEKGLLILTAGHNDVIRFLPPLTISYDEINEALEILKECL